MKLAVTAIMMLSIVFGTVVPNQSTYRKVINETNNENIQLANEETDGITQTYPDIEYLDISNQTTEAYVDLSNYKKLNILYIYNVDTIKTLDLRGSSNLSDIYIENCSVETILFSDNHQAEYLYLSDCPNLKTIEGSVAPEYLTMKSVALDGSGIVKDQVIGLTLTNTNISNPYFAYDMPNLEILYLGGNYLPFFEISEDVMQTLSFFDNSYGEYFVNNRSNVIDLKAKKTKDGYEVKIDGINKDKVTMHPDVNWVIRDDGVFYLAGDTLETLDYYYEIAKYVWNRPNNRIATNEELETISDTTHPYRVGDNAYRRQHMFIVTKLTVEEAVVEPDPVPTPKEEPAVAPIKEKGPNAGDSTSVFGMLILLAGATTVLAKKKKHQ